IATYFLYLIFYNASSNTQIYTLSLHDALPISSQGRLKSTRAVALTGARSKSDVMCHDIFVKQGLAVEIATEDGSEGYKGLVTTQDRKRTRLNSSHVKISYAVFCLKKKKKNENT